MVRKNKIALLILTFFAFTIGIYAQNEFPATDYWSLDGGVGFGDILVKGKSFQAIIDPKLWLSYRFMVGAKIGVSFSKEDKSQSNVYSNILTLESQAYFRWNFLRFGDQPKQFNVFGQAGFGLLAAYRGNGNPFDDVTLTRGSALAEIAGGVTIPITERWHVEPLFRVGYPHIWGVSLTAGYKFPLPTKTKYLDSTLTRIEYVEVARTETITITDTVTDPSLEIIRRTNVFGIEYILFGPDIGRYNVGIDNDARGLNELVLNTMAKTLIENPNFRIRIEGHANPVTTDPNEADELMVLSATRSNNVAAQLREKGVENKQMVVVSFGGTRTVTSDQDIWNRNRRVELILFQVDDE